MAYSDVLVHRGRAIASVGRTPDLDDMVYGDAGVEEVEIPTEFACCIFLPLGSEEPTGRGRGVREPTLLYATRNVAGEMTMLRKEMSVEVLAPELNAAEGLPGDEWVRWELRGAPQPFGPPGQEPIGLQAIVKRIDD